jgi:hypothetical protein
MEADGHKWDWEAKPVVAGGAEAGDRVRHHGAPVSNEFHHDEHEAYCLPMVELLFIPRDLCAGTVAGAVIPIPVFRIFPSALPLQPGLRRATADRPHHPNRLHT